MSRRMTLLALIAAAMFVFAACEAADDGDETTSDESDDTEAVAEDESNEVSEEDSEQTEDEDVDEVEEPTATPEPTSTPEPEPEPTATPEPTEVAEPTEAPEPEFGTRDNPIPTGESATIADWEIKVIGTTPDANQAVAEGNQFFIARIEATYVGEESGDFWIDISLSSVDDGGVVYDGLDASCGVIPDNISDRGEAFPGATIQGNTCWSVQSQGVDSLVMIVEPLFSWDGERLFFALSE